MVDYIGQNLSKKGRWLFLIWGFPRINLLHSIVSCLCCSYCSVHATTVNVKEVK
jgi:hypothetical protein